ncbi:MAG: polysaccharide deacetylase family protein [Bacteroidota bacterium]|nr:polysaccharide deacetylase family protein [Bacteroidota bacterium]
MNLIKRIRAKTRQKWSYGYNDIRSVLGMNEKRFHHSQGTRIVIYHGLCRDDHTRFNSIFLRVKTFEDHLKFYKKHFNIISLEDYYLRRFNNDRFTICITFDDGFANNYKYVLPLMNEYGIPVTFFITGIRDAGYDILWNDFLCLAQKYGPGKFRFLDEEFYKDGHEVYISKTYNRSLKELSRGDGFDKKAGIMKLFEPLLSRENKMQEEDYWLQMTEEQIKDLSASPFATIGCHGYYHNDLSRIPVNDAGNEMIRSKQYLENITQKEINSIAFPYGAYSREVIVEAKSAGFNKLLATDFLFPEDYADPMLQERFAVNPYISVNNQMLATINGKYQ